MNDIRSLLAAGQDALSRARIPESSREVSSLLEIAIDRGRTFLIAHPHFVPDDDQTKRFLNFVERRSNHEPFHYIKGSKEFYGLEFEVSPAVLIPRPETEMLAERSISFLGDGPDPIFCEVGVGSGCISVSVLVNVPGARAVGVEISDAAIEIADRNAGRYGVRSRFDLRRSDLFAELSGDEKFDLVVSNPPYVPRDDIGGLQPDVRDHEPLMALTDGGDGLSIIRSIIADSPQFLKPAGVLLMEIGAGQAAAVRAMFDRAIWAEVRFEGDFQQIPRVVSAALRDM